MGSTSRRSWTNGIDIVVRRGTRCFIVDTRGEYAQVEVESDLLTPEGAERLRALREPHRSRMIQAILLTGFLSQEGKTERLFVLGFPMRFEVAQFPTRQEPPGKPVYRGRIRLQYSSSIEALAQRELRFVAAIWDLDLARRALSEQCITTYDLLEGEPIHYPHQALAVYGGYGRARRKRAEREAALLPCRPPSTHQSSGKAERRSPVAPLLPVDSPPMVFHYPTYR